MIFSIDQTPTENWISCFVVADISSRTVSDARKRSGEMPLPKVKKNAFRRALGSAVAQRVREKKYGILRDFSYVDKSKQDWPTRRHCAERYRERNHGGDQHRPT